VNGVGLDENGVELGANGVAAGDENGCAACPPVPETAAPHAPQAVAPSGTSLPHFQQIVPTENLLIGRTCRAIVPEAPKHRFSGFEPLYSPSRRLTGNNLCAFSQKRFISTGLSAAARRAGLPTFLLRTSLRDEDRAVGSG
jgi:hypothetical protein